MGDLLNVDMNYLIGKKESTEIIPDSYYLNPEARDMAQFLFCLLYTSDAADEL